MDRHTHTHAKAHEHPGTHGTDALRDPVCGMRVADDAPQDIGQNISDAEIEALSGAATKTGCVLSKLEASGD